MGGPARGARGWCHSKRQWRVRAQQAGTLRGQGGRHFEDRLSKARLLALTALTTLRLGAASLANGGSGMGHG
jgi:hypothetical protein